MACKASIPSSNLGATFLFIEPILPLFLVPTPIGNLADITYRAVETLSNSDYILCEDTRHSVTLLRHYSIQKPLKSYHKFNETKALEQILEDLDLGKSISLISDAGTPCIADPGAILVKACLERGIEISALPGPSATVTALSASGLSTDHFQFVGFLPKKKGELEAILRQYLCFPGTTLSYESPKRLVKTLEILNTLSPDHELVIARELTKKFETYHRGTASQLLLYFKEHPVKGEIVFLIGSALESQDDWSSMSPTEHVSMLQNSHGLELKEAIKLAAQQRGVSKRDIYKEVHS